MEEETARPDSAGVPPTPKDDSEPSDPSRRRFLIRSIVAIGGGITVAIGVPAGIFVAGSATAVGETDTWIRLGSISSIEPGGSPVLMKATVSRATGYLVEEQEISVFVTTENGSEFDVLSNICTHLGCRVRWVDDQDGFFCPCHNAIFDRNGSVVEGPPPRPLDRFQSMVEDGQLYFKET